jgi:ElaB/YqjD/DUF883 family membrane-anchored ribosome-binding protein
MAYETSDPQAGRPDAPAGLSDDMPPTSEAKTAASHLRHEAARKADQLRTPAAEKLDSVAGAVHAGGERVASAAHRAGAALTSGAEYIRGNEIADMLDDVVGLVRDNPGPALVCAAALGFVLGRAVYRH